MALFYSHNINAESKLAIWHITENETFFKKSISIQKEITHPHKRLQHYAGRYLLKMLDTDFPVENIKLDGNRPYLENNHFHFSISHWHDYAAAIISRSKRAGIDIEGESEKLKILQHKFLNESETENLLTAVHTMPVQKILCLCWSAKETMFKWYQKGKVDFRKDMNIISLNPESRSLIAYFGKEIDIRINIKYHLFDGMVLTYLVE